jgi:hypothetical protein
MKLTKERLKTIIKEELEAVLKETIAAEGVGRQIQPGGGTIPSCPELARAYAEIYNSDAMHTGHGGTPENWAMADLAELQDQMQAQQCDRQKLKPDPSV